MFENVVNHILFVLLVLLFKNRLIFSHVGRHLKYLELPKGNNSTPTWILLHIQNIYNPQGKKALSDETGLAPYMHIKKNAISLVLCSRQFFQVNKASLQRTSSTIIHLKFENVLNNILLVLFLIKSVDFQSRWSPS